MGSLDGKCAIVTGGSRGIGRAIVERLVADGATVVFSYLHRADAAKALVEDLGERVSAQQLDLAVTADIPAFFDAALEHLGALDILVNNAGETMPRLINDVSEDEYDRIMTVNAKAVFLSIQRAARHMRDGGRIVNLSTLNTRMARRGVSVYAASKAAVELFTRVAAQELGPRGITVNSISPGATDTEMLRGANSPEALQQMVAMTALGRLGQPADIADVVGFLVGPRGRWVTGQNLVVSGGLG